MTRKIVLLATVIWLSLVSAVQAGWMIDRAKVVAANAFPNGCVDVVIEFAVPADPMVAAWTRPMIEPCRVWFRVEAYRYWPVFCTTMVHEYGHLAGYGHGPGIMSAFLDKNFWPGCRDRGRALVGLRPAGYGWE